jgi:hypothetical protein
MAIPQRARITLTAQPFRPFIINLEGGRSFTVKHPENAAAFLDGHEMTDFDVEGPHPIELLMVDLIETVPSRSNPHLKETGPDLAGKSHGTLRSYDDQINHEMNEIHERIQ